MKKLPTSSFLQASSSPLNYLEPPLNYLGPPLNYLEPPLDYVGHHLNYVPLPLDLRGASFELLEATFELRGAAQQTNGWTIEVEDVGRTITDRRGIRRTRRRWIAEARIGGVGAVREDMDDERDKHRETFCFCQSVLRA